MDLLVDAIKEMVSQFIIDMMELITGVFTDLLSCNLSLFEELFSVVGGLYQNVIVPMGIAILLMILVWQLFKSMFGNKLGVNAEEPIELLGRSAICLFFVVGSKPLVNYVLKIAGTPYQWVMGTEIKVQSFSEYVSALEGITAPLGLGTISIAILMLIMQFVVAWNYFKMLFVIAEDIGLEDSQFLDIRGLKIKLSISSESTIPSITSKQALYSLFLILRLNSLKIMSLLINVLYLTFIKSIFTERVLYKF